MLLSIKLKGLISWELSTIEPHALVFPSILGPQLPFSGSTKMPPHPCPKILCISGNLPTLLKFTDPLYSTFSFPLRPLFVVIMIAPFLAFDPYNEEAAVPFNTDILSISAGLISFKPLPKSTLSLEPNMESLSGIPSTTYNGWLLLITPYPLSTTFVEEPGPPVFEMLAPAIFPDKASSALAGAALVIASLLNVDVA